MRTSPSRFAGRSWLAVACTLVCLAGPLEAAGSSAQPPGAPPAAVPVDFNVAAGEASATLKQFCEQSGQTVVYLVDVVRGQPTAAVKGRYTPREALDVMLAGSGLVASQDATTGAFAVRKGAADPNGARAASPAPGNAALNRSEPGELGTISGRVFNAATGQYLEGAQISLAPSGQSVFSERDGSYAFSPVPAGEYAVSVSYTGLETSTVAVRLLPGQRWTQETGLTSRIYELAPFVVAGEREGNAQAISLQRAAPNVKNVISADAFGNIADGNLGNFLQRLPGVSVVDDEGEIYRVMVRGMAPELNSVAIDGTRLANATNRGAAAQSMGRAVEIDKLPADFIERIEVTKAMTPDMDADSIGGSINLKTKSALDYRQRVVSVLAGSSYNVRRETFRPIGSLMFADILGTERKLGLLFTASYNKTHKPRDSVGLDHQSTTDTSQPTYYWIRFVGEDQFEHERLGLGLTLDYKPSRTSRLYFNALHGSYADTMVRRRVSTGGINAARIAPGWTDTVTQTVVNNAISFTRNSHSRDRRNDTYGGKLGGDFELFHGKLDFGINYSESNGEDRRPRADSVITGLGFRFDRTRSREFPELSQTAGPDIFNILNANLTLADESLQLADDSILGADLNYQRRVAAAAPFVLKAGLRYRRQERSVDQNSIRFTSYTGPGGIARFIQEDYRYSPLGGLYPGWTFVDDRRVIAEARQNPQYFVQDLLVTTRDSVRDDAAAEESVFGAYVMGTASFGKLTVVGGVRGEETRVNGTGSVQEITPAERARRAAWVGPVTPEETVRRTLAEFGNRRSSSGQYRDVFPSLHFKYNLTRAWQARASYSSGIGRPNFSEILPATTVNHDAMIVTTKNINLQPQYADSFDVALEYYFEPAGMFSAGAFLKEIRQFIYSGSGGFIAPSHSEFGGLYDGYELRSTFNGGWARVRGWEVAYQQQFSNLPGFWRGFGAFGNYTYTDARGDYGQPGAVVTGAELVNFAPHSANLGLSYIARGWTVRAKINFRAATLNTYNVDPSRRIYVTPSRPIDLNLRYDWSHRFGVFLDVINVFDVPTSDNYLYVRSRPLRSEQFTTAVKFGVSGRY